MSHNKRPLRRKRRRKSPRKIRSLKRRQAKSLHRRTPPPSQQPKFTQIPKTLTAQLKARASHNQTQMQAKSAYDFPDGEHQTADASATCQLNSSSSIRNSMHHSNLNLSRSKLPPSHSLKLKPGSRRKQLHRTPISISHMLGKTGVQSCHKRGCLVQKRLKSLNLVVLIHSAVDSLEATNLTGQGGLCFTAQIGSVELHISLKQLGSVALACTSLSCILSHSLSRRKACQCGEQRPSPSAWQTHHVMASLV